jgi:integrase
LLDAPFSLMLTITYSTERIQTMARRMKGAGSVYERKDGYWVAQYKGQYRYAKTEREAKKKLLELIKAGETRKPGSKTTVAAFMDRWITFAEQNLKPATVKRYREVIEIHIKPNLGSNKLHKLDAMTVQDMYASMQHGGLSPATVNLVHSVMSSACKRAVKWGVLHHNIIESVEAPRIVREEVEVFTPQEVRTLLSAAFGDRLQALYTLALSTGMRGGEILGLEWRFINLDAGTLDVRQTTTIKGQLGTPKSKNSVRTLQLPQIARDALRIHSKSSRFVFPNRKGTDFIRYNSFVILHWRPLTQRAGIPYKNFHTCRHYVASSLLGKGLPITAIARYLGHDEITLLRTYSHLIKGMEHLVPAAMDETLG